MILKMNYDHFILFWKFTQFIFTIILLFILYLICCLYNIQRWAKARKSITKYTHSLWGELCQDHRSVIKIILLTMPISTLKRVSIGPKKIHKNSLTEFLIMILTFLALGNNFSRMANLKYSYNYAFAYYFR